jgi:vitamin-K-epoxide reductase (warfarin-sensitive)
VRLTVSTSPECQPAGESTNPARQSQILYRVIAVLAVAGTLVSAISLQRHYAKSSSAFCDFGERFNCDIVNRSEYSTLMGIPVAAIGIVGYAFLLARATVYRSLRNTPLQLLAAALVGLAFASYLTYIEGSVLETWCILCLSSLALIASIAVLAGVLKVKAGRNG